MASALPQDEWTYVAASSVSPDDAPAVLEDLRLLAEEVTAQVPLWSETETGPAVGGRPSRSSRGESSSDDRGLGEKE